MTNEDQSKDPSNAPAKDELNNGSDQPDEVEFKVTVRKLEMPVRPRGVLAE